MITATLVVLRVAIAMCCSLVAVMSRRKFIPIAYRFFIANLVIFSVLMRILTPAQQAWLGRTFFVWLSVANLFVGTVLWAFMTDLFRHDQGKRLFGFITIGGCFGAI